MSKRTYEQITESERHAIALGLQQKQSLRAIAREADVDPAFAQTGITFSDMNLVYSAAMSAQWSRLTWRKRAWRPKGRMLPSATTRRISLATIRSGCASRHLHAT